MSWRDRDWARFNDDERRVLYGGSAQRRLPPSDEGAGHTNELRLAPTHRRGKNRRHRVRQHLARVGRATLVVLLGAGFVAYAMSHKSSVRTNGLIIRPAGLGALPAPSVSPPRKVISITWRSQDLAPAANAGRICVTDFAYGRICASYVIGERPADVLTREVHRRGLEVVGNVEQTGV